MWMACASCHIPTLQSGGPNQKWPTCGRIGYITPAVGVVPNASERETKSEVAHMSVYWLHNLCRLGGAQYFFFRAGDKITRGLHVGGLAK